METALAVMAMILIGLVVLLAHLYLQYRLLRSRHEILLSQAGNVEELELNLRKDLKAVKEFHAHYHRLREAYYNLTGKKLVPGYHVEDEDGLLNPESLHGQTVQTKVHKLGNTREKE